MLERLSAVVATKVNRSTSVSTVAAYELTVALNWGTSLRPSTPAISRPASSVHHPVRVGQHRVRGLSLALDAALVSQAAGAS